MTPTITRCMAAPPSGSRFPEARRKCSRMPLAEREPARRDDPPAAVPPEATLDERSPSLVCAAGSFPPHCDRIAARPHPRAAGPSRRAPRRHRWARPYSGGPFEGAAESLGRCRFATRAETSRPSCEAAPKKCAGIGRGSATAPLAAELVAHGEALSALLPSAGQDSPAGLRLHAGAKSVVLPPLPVAGLPVRRLHGARNRWLCRCRQARASSDARPGRPIADPYNRFSRGCSTTEESAEV